MNFLPNKKGHPPSDNPFGLPDTLSSVNLRNKCRSGDRLYSLGFDCHILTDLINDLSELRRIVKTSHNTVIITIFIKK